MLVRNRARNRSQTSYLNNHAPHHLQCLPGNDAGWEGCWSTQLILACTCPWVSNLFLIIPPSLSRSSQGHLFLPPHFSLPVASAQAPTANSWIQFSVVLLIIKVIHNEFYSLLQSKTILFCLGSSPRWSARIRMPLSCKQLGTAYKGDDFSTPRVILSLMCSKAVRQAAKSEFHLCLSSWKIISHRTGTGITCRQFWVPMLNLLYPSHTIMFKPKELETDILNMKGNFN